MRLGHFYKHSVKNNRKETPAEKKLGFFLLDILKTTFLLEDLTQRWTQSGHFLQFRGSFS